MLTEAKRSFLVDASPESVASSKVVKLNSRRHMTHAFQIKNLEMILSQGLVSGEFARRARLKNYQSYFGYPHNKRFVSFLQHFTPFNECDPAIIVKKTLEDENARGLAIVRRELLVPLRAAPRDFIGIGYNSACFAVDRDFRAKINTLIQRAVLLWEEKPQNAVPIYDLGNGEQLWPSLK